MGELRDHWSDFAAAGAVVYGVNPWSRASHAKYASKLSLPFPLLVDKGRRVAQAYNSALWLLVRRTVYVVGPDGKVTFARRGAPPPDEILKALRGA